MLIHTPILSYYRNAELIQFFEDVLTLTKKHKDIPVELQSKLKPFAEAYKTLAQSFNPDKKLLHTKGLEEIDKRRDDLTIGLRLTLVGLTKHSEEKIKKTAKLILEVLDSYGSKIYQYNYQLQTHITKNFLDKVTSSDVLNRAVDSLVLIRPVLNTLEGINNQFAAIYLIRTQEKGQKVKGQMKKLVKEATIAYREFVIRLHAYIEIQDEVTTYKTLIKDLNALIQQYNQVVYDRSGNKSVDASEEYEREENVIFYEQQ